MSKHKVTNQAPPYKYFTMMLNMADDDLDPYQYRLLAHYIRESGHGQPYAESVRVTANKTKMSTVKVQKARDELAALGYLRVNKPTKAQARKGETVKVMIVDRWAENISRYAKAVSDLTQQPASEITHYASEPVSDLTRSLKTEEPVGKSETPPTPSKKETANPYAREDELILSWAAARKLPALAIGANVCTTSARKKATEMLAWEISATPDEIRLVTLDGMKRRADYPFEFIPSDLINHRAKQAKGKIITGVWAEDTPPELQRSGLTQEERDKLVEESRKRREVSA